MSTTEGRGGRRPPLRLISIAWGERYVETFLEFCLPALLAPGNLPVLVEHFSTELVFVTETKFFPRVRSHPSYARASKVCDVRLVALDDLVATRHSYGMSLTYAFFRGFEDLGPAMTDYYLVFIHADFILADGSYRNLLPHLLHGERLVLSPSYCVIAEHVRPLLLEAKHRHEPVLAVAPRRMADFILQHRHFTIRSKTVNQPFYSLDFIEQFYWMVDESTLLARQLPIAVVAMKPERYLADVTSYWDYGVIAEFCPSMKFTVLGDSDDFLMLELRARDVVQQGISLGWPAPADIAKRLATFITDYKKVIGRARLTVHSGELPPTTDEGHARLDAYLDAVYACLPAKLLHHLDHPQWRYHFEPFRAARAQYVVTEAARHSGASEAAALGTGRDSAPANPDFRSTDRTGGPDCADPTDIVAQVAKTAEILTRESDLSEPSANDVRRAVEVSTDYIGQVYAFETAWAAFAREFCGQLAVLNNPDGDGRSQLEEVMAEWEANGSEFERRLTALIEREHGLAMAATAMHEILRRDSDRRKATMQALAVMTAHLQATARTARLAMRPTEPSPGLDETESGPPRPMALVGAPTPGTQRLITVSHRLFGSSPRYRRWHWLYSSTRLAISSAMRRVGAGDDVLHVYHDRPGLFSFLESRARSVASLSLLLARAPGVRRAWFGGDRRFDCCVIETDLATLPKFRDIYEALRPCLKAGAVMIALFVNTRAVKFPLRDVRAIVDAFPLCGPARIGYAGSWPAIEAFRVRQWVEETMTRRFKLADALGVAASMVAAAPLALIGSWIEADRTLDNSLNPPAEVSSVTVEIEIG